MDPQNIPLQPQPAEPGALQPNKRFLLPVIIGGIVILCLGLIGGFYLLTSLNRHKPADITRSSNLPPSQLPSQPVQTTQNGILLSGKVFYDDGKTHETKILDFDQKKKFSTGIRGYWDNSNLFQLESPDRSKIILPGEKLSDFKEEPLSFIKKLFTDNEVFAFAADIHSHLFIIDLLNKQRSEINGDFIISGSNNFIWLDDQTFCYKERKGMQPGYEKNFKLSLDGTKEEVKASSCLFPSPTSVISSKYVLNQGYKTQVKDPKTNEQILIQPSPECTSVPQAVLSPDNKQIAFNCVQGNKEILYILPLEEIYRGQYGKATKFTFSNGLSIQWLDDNQLVINNEIDNSLTGQSEGEVWNSARLVLVNIKNGNMFELVPSGKRITAGPVISPAKNALLYETIASGKSNSEKEGNEEFVIESLTGKELFRTPGTYAQWIN